MPPSQPVFLYDFNGLPVSSLNAPITGRPGQATYAPQGGMLALGHDYATSPTAGTAYVPRVDKTGAQYTIPATATQAGTALSSANAAIGTLLMALQGLTPTAAQMDGTGNVLAAPAQMATFAVLAQGAALGNGKSLLSLMNKSASAVVRLSSVFAQNTGTNPSVLTTYYIFAQQLHFITGYSGGTSLSAATMDTADSLPSGITLATGATVAGESSPCLRRWITSNYPLSPGANAGENTTGDQQGRDPWLGRGDPSAKLVTVRPGQGVHLKCASASSNGYQDVTFFFTVGNA